MSEASLNNLGESADSRPAPRREPPDLSQLTGVRSGKTSYYPAYVRSNERTQRAVRAMDLISRAVVRTVEGPRGLLEEVARAAADHLDAEWTILALADGSLPRARPRYVAVGPDGAAVDAEDLPENVRLELTAIRAGFTEPSRWNNGWARVPMVLQRGRVGGLSARHNLESDLEPEDHAVLRILANQAAISLHTSEQYQTGVGLHRRAQRLDRETRAQAADLAHRTAQLEAAETRLTVALQRELVDGERHRIARELHDSVTQYVLSAGMSVELARGEVAALDAPTVTAHLESAKEFTKTAVEQLRSAIFALTQPHSEGVVGLTELISDMISHHRSRIGISVITEGEPVHLGDRVHHEVARAVGEALFNVVTHARARRVVVRLRYRADLLTVVVSDDGHGEPAQLRRMLRAEQRNIGDGRHQGLRNIDTRVVELGGSVAFRRSAMGGVSVGLRIPLPVQPPASTATPAFGTPLPTRREQS